MPPVKKVTDPGVNFGDDSFYTGGFSLPEGDYVWKELNMVMHEGFGDKKFEPVLGVMITLAPLSDPAQETKNFWGMGRKADKSFAPNETGKGLMAIPGAAGVTLNDMTNWNILRKSLYDSGLPQGILSNDLSVLEGMHVHMQPVPEPEGRKGFGGTARTGEAAEEPRGNKTILIVTEIKDDGKPWEGSGGIPEEAPAKAPAKVAAEPALKAVAKAAPTAPAEDEQDLETVAIGGMSTVLEGNENGVTKLALRTGTFKAVSSSAGPEVAQQVLNTYFKDDSTLNVILGALGYQVKGAKVEPQ